MQDEFTKKKLMLDPKSGFYKIIPDPQHCLHGPICLQTGLLNFKFDSDPAFHSDADPGVPYLMRVRIRNTT